MLCDHYYHPEFVCMSSAKKCVWILKDQMSKVRGINDSYVHKTYYAQLEIRISSLPAYTVLHLHAAQIQYSKKDRSL